MCRNNLGIKSEIKGLKSKNTEGGILSNKFIVIKRKIKKSAKFVILDRTTLNYL